MSDLYSENGQISGSQPAADGQPDKTGTNPASPAAPVAEAPAAGEQTMNGAEPAVPADNARQTENGAGQQKKTFLKTPGSIVFLCVIAAAAVCGIYSMVYSLLNPKEPVNPLEIKKNFSFFTAGNDAEKTAVGTFQNDYIAILKIEGTIQQKGETYNQQWLLSTVDDLAGDDKNRALLLFIDSPGGTVYEADELYLKLLEYKSHGKPVWAYFASMAASGSYYIGCAADTIIANRNTLTGSIGVIYGSALDLTGLMEKYGVKSTTFTAGKNKNMLNYNSPVTEEQAAIMQSVVDEAYDQFTGIVADSRRLPLKTVREIADGRVYTAKQALGNGLIDKIMGYEEAQEYMQDDLFGNNGIDFQNIDYIQKKNFYSFLLDAEAKFSAAHKSAESLILDRIANTPEGLSYYYTGENK